MHLGEILGKEEGGLRNHCYFFAVCNVKFICLRSFNVRICGMELGLFQSWILEAGKQEQNSKKKPKTKTK